MKKTLVPVITVLILITVFTSCNLPTFGKSKGEIGSEAHSTQLDAETVSEEETEITSEKQTESTEEVTAETTTQETTESTTKPTTSTTRATTVITKASTTLTTAVTTAIRTTVSRTTTTKRNSTTAAYSGTTSAETKYYRSDLKYGVDLIRRVEIYYGKNASGQKYQVGETEISRTYDRSTYIASYDDLLPAAKENRQTYADMINEVLALTNAMRAENGIAPLTLDEKLTEQANVRAEEVAWSGKHSHIRPNLKEYTSIFIENGITTGTVGENLGWYYSNAKDVCDAWKASETHYKNIMDPVFTKIGIGVAAEADPTKNYCWVQHFSS